MHVALVIVVVVAIFLLLSRDPARNKPRHGHPGASVARKAPYRLRPPRPRPVTTPRGGIIPRRWTDHDKATNGFLDTAAKALFAFASMQGSLGAAATLGRRQNAGVALALVGVALIALP